MKNYLSKNVAESESIGRLLGQAMKGAGIRRAFISLRGEMGVGKTAFTRGFASAFEVNAVRSPTYTVVNEYKSGILPLFHFDLYRLADEDDLYSIGFDDYLAREGICLAEWTEKMPEVVPADAILVDIMRTDGDENERRITIVLPDTLPLSLSSQ